MIVEKIEIFNFRTFEGRQSFPFGVRKGKTVTLLFGINGAGKTTLLNAFLWCLYGELTDDVEQKERLINDSVWKRAAMNEEIPLSVELQFSHGASLYRAKRSALVRKATARQTSPTAVFELWESRNGQSELLKAPQQKLESLLPKRLNQFFFFNGERIEKLFKKEAYVNIKQDIKTMLGLEHVERAIMNLPRLRRKLGAELRKHGGEKAGELQTEIEKQEEQLASLRLSRDEKASALAELCRDREHVRERLRSHSSAGPLQKEREAAEKRLEAMMSARATHQVERLALLGSRGYLGFVGTLLEQVETVASKLHEKGNLPAPLKRDFVDSLIDRGRCICGTDLNPGTPALREVASWRAVAGLAEVESAWSRMSAYVSSMGEARYELRSRFQELSSLLEKDRHEIGSLEAELSVLNEKIKELPQEDVGGLERRNTALESQIAEVNRELGGLGLEINQTESRLVALKRDLSSAQVGDAVARVSQKRIEIVDAVEAAMAELLDIRSAELRSRLERQITDVFRQVCFKDVYPVLSDDFELGLVRRAGAEDEPFPKSTGENQILSLSFVAAVSGQARRIASHQELDSTEGWGDYPVVIDAAFGSLDTSYKVDIARALATLAPQVIIFVLKEQGLGTILTELSPHLNRLGVVVAHSNSTKKSDTIELSGREYPYVMTQSDHDWSEFLEVPL